MSGPGAGPGATGPGGGGPGGGGGGGGGPGGGGALVVAFQVSVCDSQVGAPGDAKRRRNVPVAACGLGKLPLKNDPAPIPLVAV